jgi:hypothetical protein
MGKNDQYTAIYDILCHKTYTKVSADDLKRLIQDDEFRIDSENTIMFLIVKWLFINNREDINIFLPYIKFSHMTIYFLIHIIPQIANKFPEWEKMIKNLAHRAIKYKLEKNNKLYAPQDATLVPRIYVKPPFTFSSKIEFNPISKMKKDGRLYSDSIISFGYEFLYFIKYDEISDSHNSRDSHASGSLGGYLRCIPLMDTGQHRLPVFVQLSILTKKSESMNKSGPTKKSESMNKSGPTKKSESMNNSGPTKKSELRIFKGKRFLFEKSEVAIGGKLLINDETWEDVISGKNDLVINDTITVLLTVEILDSWSECAEP